MDRRLPAESKIPRLAPTRTSRPDPPDVAALPRRDLMFFNGMGGFTPDGREYVISTGRGQVTPAPWVNVLANPHFGTVVSENGACLYVERECPRVPPHPLAQRSGQRFRRGGLLPSRRRAGPFLVAHAAAQPGVDAVRDPARIRLQCVRAHGTRDQHGGMGVRGHGRARQIHGAEGAQPDRAGRGGSPPPDTRNGCWGICGPNR